MNALGVIKVISIMVRTGRHWTGSNLSLYTLTILISSALLAGHSGAAPELAAEPFNIYVAPIGVLQGPGVGSENDPFVLSAGKEYELNQVIRSALDHGRPVRVVFRDGIYRNVRLQVIKQGIDTNSIYMRAVAPGQQISTTRRVPEASCNREGQNCRVVSQDFTVGAGLNAPLQLEADHPGRAIFDGSDTRHAGLEIDSEALVISGSLFGAPPSDPYNVQSRQIEHVVVNGLVFRNYRDGIHIRYAKNIIIRNCRIESIGNPIPRSRANQAFGTFGLRADGNSSLVLFIDNIVSDVWNAKGESGFMSGDADPGLIHSIYFGDARDIVFVRNTLVGSSGPMLKTGFYPSKSDERPYRYPASPSDRRNFFIDNHFILTRMKVDKNLIANYQMEAFIHDNSRELGVFGGSPPAAGLVFMGNRFDNELPTSLSGPVSFLRQEVPRNGDMPSFPGWIFIDNTINGIMKTYLLVERVRGTGVVATSVRHGPAEEALSLTMGLPSQLNAATIVGRERAWLSQLEKLLRGSLRSSNADEDLAVLTLVGSVLSIVR